MGDYFFFDVEEFADLSYRIFVFSLEWRDLQI
jgi:hypothetical protein